MDQERPSATERVAGMAPGKVAALLWVAVLAVYLTAVPPPGPGSVTIDVRTNELTSYLLGTTGSPFADDYADLNTTERNGSILFLISGAGGRTVSWYPAGAPLLAAPLYRLVPPAERVTIAATSNTRPGTVVEADVPDLPHWPGSVVASATTAGAVAFLFLSVDRLLGRRRALLTAAVAAFGSGAFSVAADALWQHGPAMMFLSLAGWLLVREREALAGIALAGAVFCRPQVALVALGLGVWLGARRRSLRPVLTIGATSGLGALGYAAYSAMVMGGFSQGGWVDNAASAAPTDLLPALARAWIDPVRGIIPLSPIIVVAVVGLRRAWKEVPEGIRGLAVGAVLLMVVQLRGQHWSGGSSFFGYRYPLEWLTAAGPLLALGASATVRDRLVTPRVVAAFAAASVLIHTFGAYQGSALARFLA